MVEAYHRPWRDGRSRKGRFSGPIRSTWTTSSRRSKKAGSFLDVVQAGGFDFNFGPLPVRFSILMKLASRLTNQRPQLAAELSRIAGGVNGGARHAHSIPGLQAPSVAVHRVPRGRPGREGAPAWPIEWDALNDIVSRHFQRLGICDKPVDANLGAHSALSAVVSNHFRGVIKKATRDASLFRQTWIREHGHPGGWSTKARCAARSCCGTNGSGAGEQGAPGGQPAVGGGSVPPRTRRPFTPGCSARFSIRH